MKQKRRVSAFSDNNSVPKFKNIQFVFLIHTRHTRIIHNINEYTAILRKIVDKSARDNPERYCGWF